MPFRGGGRRPETLVGRESVHSILGSLEITKERNALLSDKWFEDWQEGK